MNHLAFNLLPPKERQHVHTAILRHLLRTGLLLLVVFGLCAAGAIAATTASLSAVANREEATLAAMAARLGQGSAATLTEDIRAFNATLLPLDTMQNGFIKWSTVLETFLTTLPQHILIHSLTASAKDNTITIDGIAPTRADFSALQAAFTDSKVFSKLSLPPPDPLERDSITIKMTVTFTHP